MEYIGLSKNRGTLKSSILIRFSIIYHPFWGTSIFGNTHMGFGELSICFTFLNPRFFLVRQAAASAAMEVEGEDAEVNASASKGLGSMFFLGGFLTNLR